MEIITLLKANIRHKKGAFKSIIILMFIITACTTAILSTNDNIHKSLNASIERIDAGDIAAWCNPGTDINTIKKGLDHNKNVASYRLEPVVITNSQTINGKAIENNSYEIMPWNDIYPVVNKKGNQFAKNQKKLKSGEAYVPISFSTLYNCKIGSKITIDTETGKHNLTIKGFVEEPLLGASLIGIKTYFVSKEDFDTLNELALKSTSKKDRLRLLHYFMFFKRKIALFRP